MAVWVVHGLAMKLRTVLSYVLSPRRQRSMVALAVVEMMVDMPIKMLGTVEPRPSANEDAAGEPFGTVVAIGSAIVRRRFVVSVRTNRRLAYANRHLRR